MMMTIQRWQSIRARIVASTARVSPRSASRAPRLLAWLILASAAAVTHSNAASASCAAPANPIEAENCNTGSSSNAWRVDDPDDATIQGYATDMSVNVGGTINFKINTSASAYTIDIYRVGYYGGAGARFITSVAPSAHLPQVQPPCKTDAATALYDCGTWGVSASWPVPSTATSGVYIATLIRGDTNGRGHIVFVVRNDASTSKVLFRTSDASWQAYNPYGGHSLYGPGSNFDLTNRAYKVSYNRPFNSLNLEDETWLSYAESPMIYFLEANGYDVSYQASVDAARNGALIKNHKLFLSVGHDEYVSGPERTSIEAARDAGVNLAFFSGNELFWKTRWENSIDGTGTAYRTLVCYKETLGPNSVPVAVAAVDPMDPPTWTGTWRDPAKSPPADGGRPENALTGQLFRVNGPGPDNMNLAIQVPAAQGKMRFWRNTNVARQATGQVWTLPAATLGYEWDAEEDNGHRPAGLFDLSTSTYNLTVNYLQDAGGLYGAGTATHHLSLYKAASGALVFGAGSVQWSWGLNADHSGTGGQAADLNMQQATVNLFADMGVQPATLQTATGLTAATASTDRSPPISTITAPSSGSTAHVGNVTNITGTALDAGGGLVAGVEVSTDGGTTWHPAIGTSSWTYAWTPAATGTATIKSRGVDDSGNVETPSSTVTVSIGAHLCPCSLFGTQTPTNTNENDGVAYELGMKFQVARPGQVSAIRYYKASNETGTHTGRIWSGTGTLLASVAFTNETSSGWQQQALTTPLSIQANTTYVVSTNINAFYVDTPSGLASSITNGDVSSVADGANGVYGNTGTFPSSSFQNTNYFRDLAFAATTAASVVKVSGDGQSALPGTVLANPVVVKLLDVNGVPVSGATVSFSVTAGGGSVSPASAITNSSGQASATVTLGSSAGANTIHAGATGYGSVDFNETAQSLTVFTNQTPATLNNNDGAGYELGMKFQSSAPAQITAIRYWKASSETGAHTGRIWSASGTLLGSIAFSGETASGWQLQALTTPVTILPNTTYVVSVNANSYYVATGSGLASSVSNGVLSTVADGLNGVFGSPGLFPTSSYQSSNYFRDVTLVKSAGLIKSSGDNQTGSPATALPNPFVVTVLNSSGTAVSGVTVTFGVTAGGGSLSTASAVTNASGQVSTILTLGATAGANTVHVTATGYGSVDFTAVSQAYSVFTTQSPTSPNLTDSTGYELGMKFQSTKAGKVVSIRYWKSPSESGTHTGTIWSATGAQLAQVAFTGETASGWQTQALTTPLSITASTTYVVSVNANVYYPATSSGLATAVVNGPLTSVADGTDGVFNNPATFPNSSYQNTNYFRDVGFVPQ